MSGNYVDEKKVFAIRTHYLKFFTITAEILARSLANFHCQ